MEATADVTRPALRWHGGKWRLAPWIISHFPPHRIYVEPYGGAASVLLRKPRSYSEVWNDLDGVLRQFFSVLRDRNMADELIRRLELTPYHRMEFEEAYEAATDPIEQARRTLIRSFMGFGSDGAAGQYSTGFRSNVSRQGTTPAMDWTSYPTGLRQIVSRLAGVTFEARPALALFDQYDSPETLFFVDPPYLPITRSAGNRRRGQGFHVYAHEMEDADHVELLDRLKAVAGMVVLCGYPSDLYDAALTGWRRLQRRAWADGGRARTECLWINPAAMDHMRQPILEGI